MKKTIWIVNEYAGTPYHGMGMRHYYLAQELVKKDFDVNIITSGYSHLLIHPPKMKKKFQIEKIDGINYLWIKTLKYSQSHSLKRVLKWFDFAFSLFILPVKKLKKPDYIIFSSANSTLPIYPLYRYAKKIGVKIIFEVRDIWPLTAMELGSYSKYNPLISLLRFFEVFAIKKSDLLISLLPGYGKYLKDNGYNKNFLYLPNGISLDDFDKKEPLDKNLIKYLFKEKFIIGYAGSIGIANALHSFIEAGKILKDYKDIVLLIVGEGDEKLKLIELAKGYDNIIFLPAIPKRQVPTLLQYFDVCFIGWRNKKIYKYGVSPNKIFDYMYAGKPILEAINTEESLVIKANCGLQVEAENPEAIAKGILKLYNMSEDERIRLGRNGRKYVLENHTYDKLAEKLINKLYEIERD